MYLMITTRCNMLCPHCCFVPDAPAGEKRAAPVRMFISSRVAGYISAAASERRASAPSVTSPCRTFTSRATATKNTSPTLDIAPVSF